MWIEIYIYIYIYIYISFRHVYMRHEGIQTKKNSRLLKTRNVIAKLERIYVKSQRHDTINIIMMKIIIMIII